MTVYDRRRHDGPAWRDQLAEIVGTLPAGVLVHNHDGVIAYANAEAARILGHTQLSLIGKRYTDSRWKVTTPDGSPLADEERVVGLVMRTGESVYDFEAALERPDGTRVVLSVNGAPFADSSGKVQAVITSFTDITERKKVEQEHEKMRLLLGSVMEHVPVGIILSDVPSGRLIMNNRKIEEMWAPFIDANPMDFSGAACPAGSKYARGTCPLARSLRTGQALDDVRIDFGPSQGCAEVNFTSAPICDRVGRPIAAVAIVSEAPKSRT